MSLVVIRSVVDAGKFIRESGNGVGRVFVVEVRSRGQKPNQALTTFYTGSCFYHFIINGDDDLKQFPDGTLVEAECTGVSVIDSLNTNVYGKFLKTCRDDVYPLHRIVDFPSFYENKADITENGARIVVAVEGFGFNNNQGICTLIDYESPSANGVRLVINYIVGLDASVFGQEVQAVVTGTKPNPLGLTVFCSFVCFPRGSQSPALLAPVDPIAQQRRLIEYGKYVNNFKAAEDAALAAVRSDLQVQQEAGEASTYGLEVSAYRALREQGINTEPLLQMYALHAYMVNHDYTLAALARDYPKVYRFWNDATSFMQKDSDQYQANKLFMKKLSSNFPDWMATLRFTNDRLCTYHNGCNQQGYGERCSIENCPNPHRCMLCNNDKHGLFHYTVVDYTTRKYKCAKLEKYYAELAVLQENWVYKGRPISEEEIQQLFGANIPLTLLPLLREMHYERLLAKYRAWKKESDQVEKLMTYSESAKPARRKKLEERKAVAALTYHEIEEHNLFHMLVYREILPKRQLTASDADALPAASVVASTDSVSEEEVGEAHLSPGLLDSPPFSAPRGAPVAVPSFPVPAVEPVLSTSVAQPADHALAVHEVNAPVTPPLSLSLEDTAVAAFEGLSTRSNASDADTPKLNAAVSDYTSLSPLTLERQLSRAEAVDQNEAEEAEAEAEEEAREKQPVFEYMVDRSRTLIFSDDSKFKYAAGSEVYKAFLANRITGVTQPVVVKLFPLPNDQKKAEKDRTTDILRTEMAVMDKMESPYVVHYLAYTEIRYPNYPGCKQHRALILKQEDMSVDEYLQRHMGLSDTQYFEKIRPIFKQLVQAYMAIHAENIIHRDVKPDNILVSLTAGGEAVVKVCDFGLSKFQETLTKGTENLTKATNRNSVVGYTCVGTVHNGCWYSPEVLKIEWSNHNAPKHGRASDVWPLGLVFFYLASRGVSPIASKEDTMLAASDNAARLGFLRSSKGEIIDRTTRGRHHSTSGDAYQWRLEDQNEALFDLVEKMVRPVAIEAVDFQSARIPLAVCGLHPFFWDNTVVVRVVHEYVKEVNTQRSDISSELFHACQPFLQRIGGWNKNHPMFEDLWKKDEYNTDSPDGLLRALRNVLEHRSVHEKNVSARAYQEDIVNTFRSLYTPVLLRFFEVTMRTGKDGKKKYGEWTGQFTESFEFKFKD